MRERLSLVLAALAVIVAALWIAADPDRRARLQATVGLEPEIVSDASHLSAAEIEVEIARLAALPVPGLGRSGDDRALQMGVLADHARQCVLSIGTDLKQPELAARLALMRYLLIFGAIATDADSPLLEERFKGLRPLLATGPTAIRALAAERTIDPAGARLLADFRATYGDVDHPAYRGLQIYENTYEALDFRSMIGKLAERPVLDCLMRRLAPEEGPVSTASQPANQGAR